MSIRIEWNRSPMLSGPLALVSGWANARRQAQEAESAAQFQVDQQKSAQWQQLGASIGQGVMTPLTYAALGPTLTKAGVSKEAQSLMMLSQLGLPTGQLAQARALMPYQQEMERNQAMWELENYLPARRDFDIESAKKMDAEVTFPRMQRSADIQYAQQERAAMDAPFRAANTTQEAYGNRVITAIEKMPEEVRQGVLQQYGVGSVEELKMSPDKLRAVSLSTLMGEQALSGGVPSSRVPSSAIVTAGRVQDAETVNGLLNGQLQWADPNSKAALEFGKREAAYRATLSDPNLDPDSRQIADNLLKQQMNQYVSAQKRGAIQKVDPRSYGEKIEAGEVEAIQQVWTTPDGRGVYYGKQRDPQDSLNGYLLTDPKTGKTAYAEKRPTREEQKVEAQPVQLPNGKTITIVKTPRNSFALDENGEQLGKGGGSSSGGFTEKEVVGWVRDEMKHRDQMEASERSMATPGTTFPEITSQDRAKLAYQNVEAAIKAVKSGMGEQTAAKKPPPTTTAPAVKPPRAAPRPLSSSPPAQPQMKRSQKEVVEYSPEAPPGPGQVGYFINQVKREITFVDQRLADGAYRPYYATYQLVGDDPKKAIQSAYKKWLRGQTQPDTTRGDMYKKSPTSAPAESAAGALVP